MPILAAASILLSDLYLYWQVWFSKWRCRRSHAILRFTSGFGTWYLYIGPLPLMAKRLINQLYRLIVPALVNTELNYLLSPSITGFLCFYIFDTWAQYRLAAPNDKRATGLTANDNLWPHRPPAASHNRHNIAIVTGARGQLLHTVILHLPKLCNKSCNATVHVSNMHTGRYKRHLD